MFVGDFFKYAKLKKLSFQLHVPSLCTVNSVQTKYTLHQSVFNSPETTNYLHIITCYHTSA